MAKICGFRLFFLLGFVFLIVTVYWMSPHFGKFTENDQKTLTDTSYKKFLYMTFDDGPNFGTEVVLDAFKAAGGKGTFFVNCYRICTCEIDPKPEYYKKGNCSANQAALLRMVREGHTLGDHSSDHMAHNHIGPRLHYVGEESDLPYFGEANIAPIVAFLRMNNVEEKLVKRTEETMRNVKRLPFKNIWQVPGVRPVRQMTPLKPLSQKERARRVAKAIAIAGGHVYGWDIHWGFIGICKQNERQETLSE